MPEILENIFIETQRTWWTAFGSFFILFTLIYVLGIALTTVYLRYVKKQRHFRKIFETTHTAQPRHEIINSFLSIFIFSIQAILFQWLYAHGYFRIEFNNPLSMLWEVPILFLWNEIHFYCCHWLMHRRWFLKNVHYIHHLSKEPTVFSIFSFHWLEAFLLGTVIFFPLLVHDFYVLSLVSLPILSGILNFLGHSNHAHQPTNQDSKKYPRFIIRHTMHHKWSQGNYGFMLPFLDHLFNTELPKNKK